MAADSTGEGFAEFHHPQLAAVYDAWNTGRDDHAFYIALAEDLRAQTGARAILDVGCGTGQVTCPLAERGFTVTGVDPAAPMLEVARARPGGHLVRWIEGTADAYLDAGGPPVDVAIMSAHVAQVIHDDTAWLATLAATHRALRPGGTLAFESRNPAVEGWRAWSAEAPHHHVASDALGPLEIWFDALTVERNPLAGDLARCEIHYRFDRTGEHLVSRNALRFRSRARLETQLTQSGFALAEVYGNWDRSPLTPTSPEMIFIARAL